MLCRPALAIIIQWFCKTLQGIKSSGKIIPFFKNTSFYCTDDFDFKKTVDYLILLAVLGSLYK